MPSSSVAERLPFIMVVLAGAGLLLGLSVPGPEATDRQASEASGHGGLLIVATGNEKGFIRPCGCSKPALGGVHRRATVVEKLRKETPALHLVSLGDLVVTGGRQQRIKLETFLMSMDLMGYAAWAPGPGELHLGVDWLAGMRDFTSFPMVGLNVFRGGERLFAPSARLGEGPWVLTGLMPPVSDVDGVEVRPAMAALKDWLLGLEDTDRALVLWNGEEAGARALAEDVPEAWRKRTVILFGGTYDQPFPLKDTAVRVASVGSKGRFLAFVRPDGEPWLSDMRLEEEIAKQPDVSAMLDGYRQSLADEKLVETFPRRQIEAAYAGEKACTDCHEPTCSFLDTTPHERAWATLVETGDQHDPECVRCHVTGWGDSTGFISLEKTPQLINVTCEACHGPSEEHASIETPTPNGKVDAATCVHCHDPDNSPHFTFEKYWPKIAHPPPK